MPAKFESNGGRYFRNSTVSLLLLGLFKSTWGFCESRSVCSFRLCGLIVANPIIYRLVPSPSRYEIRQYGLPCCLLYKLQLVQNCAARLILGGCKFNHVTPLLRELHWLPVDHRITFKLLLITFKALNNLAPCYIGNLLHSYTPNRLLRSSPEF